MTRGTCTHIGTQRFLTRPGVTAGRSTYCHSHRLFLECCVFKLFTSQKLAAIGNIYHIQLNFYLIRIFQAILGIQQQH